ncbi:MAG: site-2 protease family protein [Polyangiaceae bacterium]
MPALHPDSSDSPTPSATPSERPHQPLARGKSGTLDWRTNAALFVTTVGSVFVTLFFLYKESGETSRGAMRAAAQFTGALLATLVAHEFGHYIAARAHRVNASLPYFIPLPFLSPFGTMGAVIRMRSTIPTRRALLDIGAAGPLAGLIFAIPLYAWGVTHSRLVAIDGGDGGQLGASLLLRWLDARFAPTIPDGMDLMLSPVAYASWAGMFVTMINLLPAGQLDGGHVAYALFGPRQDRIATWVHRSMLVFFFVSVSSFVARDLRGGFGLWHLGRHVYNSMFWLVWFEVLATLGSFTTQARARRVDARPAASTRVIVTFGLVLLAYVLHDHNSFFLWAAFGVGLAFLIATEARWGALRPTSTLLDHPPTGPEPLDFGRAVIAVITLAFFVLLFMPSPFVF